MSNRRYPVAQNEMFFKVASTVPLLTYNYKKKKVTGKILKKSTMKYNTKITFLATNTKTAIKKSVHNYENIQKYKFFDIII